MRSAPWPICLRFTKRPAAPGCGQGGDLMTRASVELFLCGDVVLGRGIDEVLPNPGDPQIQERYVRSAKDYVALAEADERADFEGLRVLLRLG